MSSFFLFALCGAVVAACVDLGCRACVATTGCNYCLESQQCGTACARPVTDAFAQCPSLERKQGEALIQVIQEFADATPPGSSWLPYLAQIVASARALKCPGRHPIPTSNLAFSCVDGHVWTMALDTAGVSKFRGRAAQLHGTLSPALLQLTQLRTLYLPDHMLSGDLPDLGSLTQLTRLFVNSNRFTGQFPDISRLTDLQEVWADKNEFDGPLPDLPASPKLTTAHFANNKFEGGLPRMAAAEFLNVYTADHNRLSGVEFPPLPPRLRVCRLGSEFDDDNCFGVGACPAPCVCHENVVQCTLRPSERQTLMTFVQDLTKNGTRGKLSIDAIVRAATETKLCPQLDGDDAMYCSAGRVSSMTLNGKVDTQRERSMSIPLSLGALNGAAKIVLTGFGFSGRIPELRAFQRLSWLDLSNNHLSEGVEELTYAPALVHLMMQRNALKGNLPNLSRATRLETLRLDSNNLSGDTSNLQLQTLPTYCLLAATDDERNCFSSSSCFPGCECSRQSLNCTTRPRTDEPTPEETAPESVVMAPNAVPQPLAQGGSGTGWIILGVVMALVLVVVVVWLVIRQNKVVHA